MKRLSVAIVLMIVAPAMAFGQDLQERRGWGYGFAGFGGVAGGGDRTVVQAGGGGEALLYKGIGVGAEAGIGNDFGIVSVNGSYHFVKPGTDRKLVPFVTAGYSLLIPTDSPHLINFGGGVNYWLSNHVALRVELRDHVFTTGNNQLVGFRVGVALR